jgi:hypothetical protein
MPLLILQLSGEFYLLQLMSLFVLIYKPMLLVGKLMIFYLVLIFMNYRAKYFPEYLFHLL